MSDSGVNDQLGGSAAESEQGLAKMSPGARLAAYREERGWTVEQVASQLNLAPRQIIAIEQDDYPSLPGMPIVRGFIRAYAKLLKVDPAPLLAGLGGETVLVHESLVPKKTLSTPFSENRLPSMAERPGLSSKWVIGSLLVVLVGVAIWAVRQDGSKTVASAPKESAASAAGGETGQKSETTTADGAGATLPAPVESSPASPAATPAESPAQAVGPAVLPTPAATQPSPPAVSEPGTGAGKDTLRLAVREDSWVEVRRTGNNGILLSRIVKAGETENVEITEPVSVVIGNAAGVEATFRGAPVELKSSAKTNVARLTLK